MSGPTLMIATPCAPRNDRALVQSETRAQLREQWPLTTNVGRRFAVSDPSSGTQPKPKRTRKAECDTSAHQLRGLHALWALSRRNSVCRNAMLLPSCCLLHELAVVCGHPLYHADWKRGGGGSFSGNRKNALQAYARRWERSRADIRPS